MQAKQPNKDGFDQQFEDYAWSQMSALLDQELPVQEEKKRRWLLWLFLFLGLSVSGAIVYQAFRGEKQVKVEMEQPIAESKMKREQDIENNEQLTVSDEQLTINNKQIENEKSEVRNQKSNRRDQESRAKSRDELLDLSRKDNTYSSNNNQTISNHLEQDRTTLNKIKQDQTTIYNQEENSNVVSSNSNDQTPSSKTQITEAESPITNPLTLESLILQNFDPFNPLPTVRSMNISPIEPITSATRSITAEPIVRKISSWELAARLGGIATLDGETHFTLGTDVQYHFKPKWSIRSGASWIATEQNRLFSFSRVDESIPLFEDMDTSSSGTRVMTEANNTYTNADFQDSIINILSPQHQFLSIPLSLEYRLNNRFSAYGGLQILLPFGQKSTADKGEADLATADPNMFIQTQGTNLLENPQIRASWQWHTGVHFRATERFSLDFSYHHVLPKQRGRNHLEQYLELGLRYNIFSP